MILAVGFEVNFGLMDEDIAYVYACASVFQRTRSSRTRLSALYIDDLHVICSLTVNPREVISYVLSSNEQQAVRYRR